MSSIAKILEGKHSKETAMKITNLILANPARIEELMECFFSDVKIICQRASWPLGILGAKHPEIIEPFNMQLLEIIKKGESNDTVVRNILRTWKEMDFEEDIEGEIFDESFRLFRDVKQAAAIRVFAMYICVNIACKYPDLAHELIPEIEPNLTHERPGVRSGSKKSLLTLHKLIENSD